MQYVFLRTCIPLIVIFVFALSGCGYKPSSYYAKQTIRGKVFVEIQTNLQDPKNSVLIKDAMNELVVSRFGTKIVNSRSEADTTLDLKLSSVSLSALQYDNEAYVKLYRATSNITIEYKNPQKSGTVSVSGYYDFTVDDGTVISDTKRYEAIRSASAKAFDEVMSKLAIESMK